MVCLQGKEQAVKAGFRAYTESSIRLSYLSIESTWGSFERSVESQQGVSVVKFAPWATVSSAGETVEQISYSVKKYFFTLLGTCQNERRYGRRFHADVKSAPPFRHGAL